MKRGRDDQAQSGPSAKRGPLPSSSQKAVPNSGAQNKLTTSDALSYLREVKNRFANNKDVYDTFLEIMKEFKAQRIDTGGVIGRVKKLFKGHRELILGFNTFLPKGYEIELARISDDEAEEEEGKGEYVQKQPVEFDQAINYVNKIKARFAHDDRVYKAFLEILNMYRKGQKSIHAVYNEVAVLFKSHADLLEEFTYFLPDAQAAKESYNRARGGGAAYSRGGTGGRGRGSAASPPDMRSQQHKRKAAKKAEEGFRAGYGYDDIADVQRATAGPNLGAGRELQYFERVKVRVRTAAGGAPNVAAGPGQMAFNDMLKCIHLYNQEIISRGELIGLVNDVIGKHQDLMAGFHEFLVKCETMDLDSAARGAGLPAAQRESLRQKAIPKDKLLSKPLSEIVAHETERVTPSYVKIPVGYPKLACSGRTPLGSETLNDVFVNVITGSEDYSFKLMRKNQYEEALFRCEDDRYEFDMCIEVNASTLRHLRPIAQQLNSMSPDERAAYQIDESLLNPTNTKAINGLYGESGPVLLELLRRNPAVTIPVLVTRMEQKDAEWRKVKEEMTKVWRKIYEQNYHKSLDHRSFYFKQAEKKALLPKTMVQEVREAAERRRQQQPMVTLRTAETVLDAPDLTFDYSDRLVFEDCWCVLRTAISEALGSGQREQVLGMYLRLVEPVFGLKLRQEELTKVQLLPFPLPPMQQGQRAGGERGRRAAGNDADARSDSTGLGRGGDASDGVDQVRGGASKASTPDPTEMRGGGEASGAEDMGMEDGPEAGSGRDYGADTGAPAAGGPHQGCAPLAPYTELSAREGAGPASSSGVSGGPPNRLLLANELMYIFFRFHRHLYERLWGARKCAAQQAQAQQQQQQWAVATPLADNGGAGEGGASDGGAAQGNEAAAAEEADRLHGVFMAKTQQLLTGELEISAYEDQVRALLGTNSYELFTLDKLIHKLINQLRMMAQDPQSMRLWDLHRYESARSSGSNALTYHINAQHILDDQGYWLDYRPSSGEMRVSLVDPERYEVPFAGEGMVNDYITAYLHLQATRAPEDSHPLFLRRNVPALRPGSPPESAAAAEGKGGAYLADGVGDDVMAQELLQYLLCNGLECKISTTTSRVSYVLGTEDILCRRKVKVHPTDPSYRHSRQARFLKWLEAAIQKQKREAPASAAATEGAAGEGAEAEAGADAGVGPGEAAAAGDGVDAGTGEAPMDAEGTGAGRGEEVQGQGRGGEEEEEEAQPVATGGDAAAHQ